MNKFVIASDIHIYDFNQYNADGFRLNQFIRLAHRLVEIGKEAGTNKLILAGDIIHKAVLQPYVVHVAKHFFDILEAYYDQIEYVIAQHDAASKSQNLGFGDSLIPIICPKAIYRDKQIVELSNGKTMAFSNWRPEQDWDFIPNSVDVLIGHLTLHPMYGQEYDSSKYKLGFFGDIHQKSSYDDGRTNTINTPIPHYISDEQEGSVIVLDTDTMEWERVPTESDSFKYLKIYYEDECPAELVGNYPHLLLVGRSKTDTAIQHIHKSIDVDEVINSIVSKRSLEQIHNEISSLVDRTGISPLNLDFRLLSMKINNFRSIDEFEYTFDPGLTTITGHNGAGKSSFITALDYVLNNSSVARTYVKKGTDIMSVGLVLEYEGRTHNIIRGVKGGSGSLEYLIDGVKQEAGKMTELHSKIHENLPWLKHYGLLHRAQKAPGLLSNYGFTDRINMVSELLGLGLIGGYQAVAKHAHSGAVSKTKLVDEECNGLRKVIEEYSDVDFSPITQEQQLRTDLEEVNTAFQYLEDQQAAINELNVSKGKLSQTESLIEGLDVKLDGNEQAQIKEFDELLQQGQSLLKSWRDANSEFATESGALNATKINLESRINKLKNSLVSVPTECDSCHRPFDPANYEDTKKHIQTELDKAQDELTKHLQLMEGRVKPHSDADITEVMDGEKSVKDQKQILVNRLNSAVELDKLLKKRSDLQDEVQEKDSKVKTTPQELAEVRPSLTSRRDQINQELGKISTLKTQETKLSNAKLSLIAKSEELDLLKTRTDILKEYADIFAPNGDVTASVFKTVAEQMSGSKFQVRTVKELAGGDTRIDFDVMLGVGSLMLPYGELSGGQQSYADAFFMSKLFKMSGSVGMLILDETWKEIDADRLEEVAIEIKSAPIRSIILTTHVDSFSYYDSRLMAELVGNTTKYSVHGRV